MVNGLSLRSQHWVQPTSLATWTSTPTEASFYLHLKCFQFHWKWKIMANSTLTEASQKSNSCMLGNIHQLDIGDVALHRYLPQKRVPRSTTMQGYQKWAAGEWQPGYSDNQICFGQFHILTLSYIDKQVAGEFFLVNSIY